MVLLIISGGLAVIGSYIYGALFVPNAGDILWGGVPPRIRPLYIANMFLAASGYFAFTYFILFRLDASQTRVFHRFGYGVFNLFYAAILIPSAAWLALTFAAVTQSSHFFLWMARLALLIVGLASLGLLATLLTLQSRSSVWAHRLAVVGCLFFCLQTAVLDALVWSISIKI